MAPAVAVVAELLAVLELEAVRLPLLPVRLQVPVGRVLLSHKLLPLLLQVAVLLAVRRVVLPQEAEVAAAVELVQGLVASEILRRR